MINNIGLPKHWKTVRLGEYVIAVKGKKPKRISTLKTSEFSIPYVNIKAFEKNIIDEFTDGSGCVLCEEGDFLMVWDGSRSGYVGKAIDGALGSTLVKLKFPGIYTNFAYYFLQSKYIEINTRAKGVGIPHVDPNLLWNYNLPIPPFQEQITIVSKIEELLSDLENGKQQLLLAQQQLKVYRQSILKWAFEGRLTNQNSKNGELPKGWKFEKLGRIAIKITDGEHITPKRTKEGYFLFSARNIQNGYLSLEQVDFVDEGEYKRIVKRCNPEYGDILISCSGSIGRVCKVPKGLKFVLVRSVALVKLDWNNNSSQFYEYLFQSPLLQRQIEKSKKATAQANLFLSPIRNLNIIVNYKNTGNRP